MKTPASLQYHLADIYLAELDKVLAAFPEVRSSSLRPSGVNVVG